MKCWTPQPSQIRVSFYSFNVKNVKMYNIILMQKYRENQSYQSSNHTSNTGRQVLKKGLKPFLNLLAKQHHSFGAEQINGSHKRRTSMSTWRRGRRTVSGWRDFCLCQRGYGRTWARSTCAAGTQRRWVQKRDWGSLVGQGARQCSANNPAATQHRTSS